MADRDVDENQDQLRRSAERPHLRRLVAAYAAAAVRMRSLRSRTTRRRAGEPLDVVMLSAYPPEHYGTVSRLGRWVRHLEARDCRVRILCPCDDATYAEFRQGSIADDYAFQHASLARGQANLREAAQADVVVLHRGVLPFGPWQRPTFEQALYRANPRVVFDFYDSVWEGHRHAHAHSRGRLARWLNPADKIETLVRGAAAVTASNAYLVEFARRLHDRASELPMLLEPEPYTPRAHARTDVVTLGWMGGPWNIERLRSIAPALRRAAQQVPLRVRVICSRSLLIDGVEIDHANHPWSFESELRDLASFDIGLLPLFDDPHDRGKSPFKLLQYSAAGLPTIATPVAIDPNVFRDGADILFARDEDAWVNAIVTLAEDVGRRARMGAAARRVLEKHYTFDAHADAFHALLCDVADGG